MPSNGANFSWIAAAAVAFAALTPTQASAAIPTVRASSCPGCDMPGMRLHAQNMGKGIAFVYDLDAKVVTKWNVDAEPCGSAAPALGVEENAPAKVLVVRPGVDEQPISEDAVQTLACGGRLVADSWPMDASVQDQFNALVQARALNKSLIDMQNARAFSRDLGGGNDPYTQQPWDLPGVAWEYPQGAGNRFVDAVAAALQNKAAADKLAPGLGIYLFDYATKQTTVNMGLSGAGPAVSATVTWDRSKNATLNICDSSNNCAKFSIVVSPTAVAVTYVGVFDSAGNQYPSPKQNTPAAPIWTWGGPHAGGGANDFGSWLQRRGVTVTGMTSTCNSYTLSCAWKNSVAPSNLIGCYLNCN